MPTRGLPGFRRLRIPGEPGEPLGNPSSGQGSGDYGGGDGGDSGGEGGVTRFTPQTPFIELVIQSLTNSITGTPVGTINSSIILEGINVPPVVIGQIYRAFHRLSFGIVIGNRANGNLSFPPPPTLISSGNYTASVSVTPRLGNFTITPSALSGMNASALASSWTGGTTSSAAGSISSITPPFSAFNASQSGSGLNYNPGAVDNLVTGALIQDAVYLLTMTGSYSLNYVTNLNISSASLSGTSSFGLVFTSP